MEVHFQLLESLHSYGYIKKKNPKVEDRQPIVLIQICDFKHFSQICEISLEYFPLSF